MNAENAERLVSLARLHETNAELAFAPGVVLITSSDARPRQTHPHGPVRVHTQLAIDSVGAEA